MSERQNPSQRQTRYRNSIAAIAAMALSMPALLGAAIQARLRPFGGGSHSRVPGKRNPAGTKICKRVAKVRGLSDADGLYFHGGELTKAAAKRSAQRRARKERA